MPVPLETPCFASQSRLDCQAKYVILPPLLSAHPRQSTWRVSLDSRCASNRKLRPRRPPQILLAPKSPPTSDGDQEEEEITVATKRTRYSRASSKRKAESEDLDSKTSEKLRRGGKQVPRHQTKHWRLLLLSGVWNRLSERAKAANSCCVFLRVRICCCVRGN